MEPLNMAKQFLWNVPFDLSSISWIAGGTFVLYLSGHLIYRIFLHPLRHIPGPLLARLTYGYQIYYDAFLGGVMPKQMPRLHQKYGPLVRIAPDRIHINDPELYKRVFGPREEFIKSKYYYGNLGISESIVTMQDVKAHRVLRNALNPFFTPQTAVDQHPLLLKEIEKLLHDLRRPREGPALIDLQEALGQVFVKFTTQTIFGLNDMSDKDALTIFNGISGWFASFNYLLAFPIIPKLALMLPDSIADRFVPGFLCIRQNVQLCIDQCKARTKGAGEFVQYSNVFDMLQVADLGGHKLNETQLLHEAIELLAGGVLPTNTAACYAAYFIIAYPQVLYALKQELVRLPKNEDGIPTFQHLTDVPYLTAIVKETLRLRPVAGPGFLPRVVPPQGITVGDTFIPGGANVATGLYALNTNPTIFKNPLLFIPNRWLGDEGAELEDWFTSFSKGPRMCLGKHMAMLSIASVIAAIFSNFEFILHETDDESMDWKDETLLVNKKHIKTFIKPLPPAKPQPETLAKASTLENGSSVTKIPAQIQEADMVTIPDLFVGWAAIPTKINPHYATVAPQAEEWFRVTCKHDEKEHQKYVKADFGYFAALCAPDAAPAELHTVHDYFNWVWAFDDPFDEGSMKCRPDLIERERKRLMSVMSDTPEIFTPANHPVMYTFQCMWNRILKRSTPTLRDRYRQYQNDYMREILEQSDPKCFEDYRDLDSFCALHRESVGSKPVVALVEHCYNLDVPAYIFENPGIQRIIDLQAELILLSNDLYSYDRECRAEHYDGHNVMHILRKKCGMTQQEASDAVGVATVARYTEWDDIVANLPSWGPDVDAVVARYVEISRGTVIANLEWSFQSKRYFGSRNDEVRRTRRIAPIHL